MEPVNITDKRLCTGCHACSNRCPKGCITMRKDAEGFLYPHVNNEECISCGLCGKVCHTIDSFESVPPMACMAVKTIDEAVRKHSSSGGMFTLLATHILATGGLVFGARFDENWQVVMDCTDNVEGLAKFRGSKYVQATVGTTLQSAERYLKDGRKVLYTGSSCQIASLRKFLGKDYENLLTVDFLCHGVSSPLVWEKYLQEVSDGEIKKIKGINFRDKSNGWKRFSLRIQQENKVQLKPFTEDSYMKAFLSDLSLRPACYHCTARNGRSGSDISIGDHWAIQEVSPQFDDDKGISLVLVNTEKGKKLWDEIKQETIHIDTDFQSSKKYNGAFYPQTEEHLHRKHFFKQLIARRDISNLIEEELKITLWDHIYKRITRFL